MFNLWVQDHGPGLLSYLRSVLAQPSDADDIWQDTFLKVHQSMDRYIDQGQSKAWIYKIAKNRLVDHARSHARKPRIVPIEEKHSSTEQEPLDEVMSTELESRLQIAIEKLPEAQREVYILKQRSALTFKEIAEVLGEPQSKIVGRMHLAMKKLSDVLETYQ